MTTNQAFHTRTALAEGLRELFRQLEERLSLRSPLNVYLAGEMAIHLYTASRVTTDVDAEFGGRVAMKTLPMPGRMALLPAIRQAMTR